MSESVLPVWPRMKAHVYFFTLTGLLEGVGGRDNVIYIFFGGEGLRQCILTLYEVWRVIKMPFFVLYNLWTTPILCKGCARTEFGPKKFRTRTKVML